jgi:hypothetical protein
MHAEQYVEYVVSVTSKATVHSNSLYNGCMHSFTCIVLNQNQCGTAVSFA